MLPLVRAQYLGLSQNGATGDTSEGRVVGSPWGPVMSLRSGSREELVDCSMQNVFPDVTILPINEVGRL